MKRQSFPSISLLYVHVYRNIVELTESCNEKLYHLRLACERKYLGDVIQHAVASDWNKTHLKFTKFTKFT